MSIAKTVILGYPYRRNKFPSWLNKCFNFSVAWCKYTPVVHSAVSVNNEHSHKVVSLQCIHSCGICKSHPEVCIFCIVREPTLHAISLGIPLEATLESR